ncbi:uncharacterized protein G2W53_033239 [Senna tora]|uniref:Uncharacterized protein n=1 Tax=Senna tora TaxID=362788 RepID=A0A834SYV8_9FABA|nr:uncharacterized protein G2W53_033239 [Senna tora]
MLGLLSITISTSPLLSITISTSPFHIIKHKHASLLCSPLNPVRPSNTVCRRTPSSQHTHRRNPVLPINAVFRRTPSSEHTHHRSNTVVTATPSSRQPVVAATSRFLTSLSRTGRPGGRFKGGGITGSPSACGHIATPLFHPIAAIAWAHGIPVKSNSMHEQVLAPRFTSYLLGEHCTSYRTPSGSPAHCGVQNRLAFLSRSNLSCTLGVIGP